MELLDRIYSKTGGFMKGICWPENDLTLLSGCGIGWVRWDVPYPFEEDGSPTNGLIAYRDRCRYFASAVCGSADGISNSGILLSLE